MSTALSHEQREYDASFVLRLMLVAGRTPGGKAECVKAVEEAIALIRELDAPSPNAVMMMDSYLRGVRAS